MKRKHEVLRPSVDLASIEPIGPGDLAIVPGPVHRLIEVSAFANYRGEAPIARIVSGAVEIAKRRGYFFFTHREIGAKADRFALLGYALALAIAVAAGPDRAMGLCGTVIQVAGALAVMRTTEQAAEVIKDARDLLSGVLGL